MEIYLGFGMSDGDQEAKSFDPSNDDQPDIAIIVAGHKLLTQAKGKLLLEKLVDMVVKALPHEVKPEPKAEELPGAQVQSVAAEDLPDEDELAPSETDH